MDNEKFAIAAHVHVLLRRKTGRVTDTEWMACNVEYATEIVRFARAKAVEENMPELADWAAKLERVMGQPQRPVRRPLADQAAQVVRERMDKSQAIAFIRHCAETRLPAPDRARFVEVTETQLMSLHEGNIARFRLRPSEFAAWVAVWQ